MKHQRRSTRLPSPHAIIAKTGKAGLKSLLALSLPVLALLLASAEPGKAQTYSLQQLMDGASFTIPTSNGTSLIFQNFADASLFGSHSRQPGQLVPSPTQIFVTAINAGTSQPGLLWQSTAWAVDSSQFVDVSWVYDVVTSDGTSAMTGAGTRLQDYAAQSGTNLAISDALTNDGALLGNLRDDLSGTPGGSLNSVEFAATDTVHVEKEISVWGNSAGSASLNAFSQTFAVAANTPEPGAWGLCVGAGISGVLLARRRKRKHRN